jgi:hypothetical protein
MLLQLTVTNDPGSAASAVAGLLSPHVNRRIVGDDIRTQLGAVWPSEASAVGGVELQAQLHL